MASITLSQYGKYMELQNVSGSGDPADAPEGGIYLFASGTDNSARLYMQNEGGSVTDVMKTLDIDAFDALGGAGLHQTQDHFVFSDNGTEKKITFSNLQDAVFADVSGDATIAAGGALTIAAQAVENSMLADDAVGADELAANAVVEASIVDNAVTLAKMAGITRGSLIMGDSSGDPSLLGKGTAAQFLQSDGTDPSYVSISGDATVAAGGALTIGTGVVEHAMLAADCIDGDNIQDDVVNSEHLAAGAIDTEHLADNQVTLAKMAGLADAKFILGDSNGDPAAVTMSGDATMDNAGALTISANAIQTGMVHDDVATELAGDGLAASSGVLAVQVSGAVAITSDKVGLSGSLAGTGLTYTGGVNSIATLAVQVSGAVAITSDKVGLSGSLAGTGLTYTGGVNSIATLGLDIDGLSALGGAGLHQTQDHFAFSDNGTEKKITFSNLQDAVFADVSGDATIAAGGALTIAAQAVENSMLADDAVGADELAANAVVNASIASNAAIDMDKLDGGSLASALTDLAQGDLMYAGDVDDSNNLKSITFSNLEDAIFGNVSGDATIAAGGALTIAAQAVENSMLADDAVGADELAANAVVNASVASNAAIVATKLNFNVDLGGNVQFGTQTDDAVAFGGSISVGSNVIANAQGEATISMDNDQNVAIAAAATVGGGYGSSGVTISSAGAISADGALSIGADGAGVNAKFFGGAANEHMSYDAGNHVLYFVNGSSATLLTLGGDATTEYALDVANGSDNINKVRAAAFVTYSDESLKSDVATMNTALDTVMSLNGVEFTWKDSGERDFGFIAQDVQSVLPKAVHTADDGVQGVDYSRLTSVLVEAVKAQQVQIEELKAILKK